MAEWFEGMTFALGASMVTTKSWLDRIGGFATIADKHSDDYELGHRVAQAGGNSYSVNGYHERSRMIYDLVKNPLILEYVQDLLGPNVVAWGTHYFCKLPGDGKSVSWHQDASYWPLTPSKTVTVWLAIDAAECTQPGAGQR